MTDAEDRNLTRVFRHLDDAQAALSRAAYAAHDPNDRAAVRSLQESLRDVERRINIKREVSP